MSTPLLTLFMSLKCSIYSQVSFAILYLKIPLWLIIGGGISSNVVLSINHSFV